MKSNDESNEGTDRPCRRRPFNEAKFSRKEVRCLESITKEIAGQQWETVVLDPDEIFARAEVQELAENLVWPTTPYWELVPDSDGRGPHELRIFSREVTPENQTAYEEYLMRNYDDQMQYQIQQEARKKRKGKKLL